MGTSRVLASRFANTEVRTPVEASRSTKVIHLKLIQDSSKNRYTKPYIGCQRLILATILALFHVLFYTPLLYSGTLSLRLFSTSARSQFMSQPLRKNPNAHRMLMRMPEELKDTFSPTQIQAIENALIPRTHVIDVRLLLPLLGKGAYLVLAAGPNRRTATRTHQSEWQNQAPAAVPGVLTNVITMSQFSRNSPNAYRMLQRMPKEISITFSAIQIQAIESALIPRSHAIDVRLSLPFLGKGAYLVFAAGPNKRKHYRDLQNRNPFVMPAVCASVIVGAAVIFGLVQLKGSSLLAESDPVFATGAKFYPTVVPFKKNQRECEESGRRWANHQCFDSEHDPVF